MSNDGHYIILFLVLPYSSSIHYYTIQIIYSIPYSRLQYSIIIYITDL